MKQKDSIIQEQTRNLDDKNKTIKTLQDRVRTLEKRFEVDSKLKDEIIKQLKQQVDQQSGQIAQFTFQIHSLNQSKLKVNSSSQAFVTTSGIEKNEPKIRGKKSSLISSNSSQERISEATSSSSSSALFNVSNDKIDTPQLKSPRDFSNTILPNKSSNLNIKRQNSASSVSSENTNSSEKSQSAIKPLKNIQLHGKSSVCPDPMPFLVNNSVTINDNDIDMIPKRPNRTLPPIKIPPKFNRIVVESPHKPNNNTILHSSPDVQSTNNN